jgi:hypothetical protein
MQHSVLINDEHDVRFGIGAEELRPSIHCYNERGELENPAVTGRVPEGFMTMEEFRREAHEIIHCLCVKHGIR